MCAGTQQCRAGGPVLLAATLWGTIGPAQVPMHGGVGRASVAGWRHLVGGLALGLIALGDSTGFARLWQPHVWIPALLSGVASAANQVSLLTSVSLAGAAVDTMASVAAVPMFAGLAARLLYRQPLDRGWVIGLAVAVAGTMLLLAPGSRG